MKTPRTRLASTCFRSGKGLWGEEEIEADGRMDFQSVSLYLVSSKSGQDA